MAKLSFFCMINRNSQAHVIKGQGVPQNSNMAYFYLHGIILGIFATILIRTVNSTEAAYSSLFSPLCRFDLPPLPYALDDLEPFIDAATLKVHHQGHHKSYTTKLNAVLEDWIIECSEFNKNLVHILQHIEEVPLDHRKSIINNGGGFVNHNIYWAIMSPNPGKKERFPEGKLADDMNEAFGTYESFKEEFTGKALALFGSGYVWLSRKSTPKGSTLVITTTANQDSPISDGLRPILVIDVWEHAYYLKHQNIRQKYVADWWMVVDWVQVSKLDEWWVTEGSKDNKDKEERKAGKRHGEL
ncbi:superoxide dismutase [Mn/Fe]-like [Lineus longissimus]|uniref:superoxide dismutase [Mn/Fe]-like n=1 Tax=Lineus longissimus TaxID=88925 RepID=UPI002B4F47F2